MKNILLLLLVVSVNCFGQYPVRDNLAVDSTTVLRISKYDTVKVLMLVCDTSLSPGMGRYLYYGKDVFLMQRRMVEAVWWQFGHEVYEMDWGSVPCKNQELAINCFGWYRDKFIGRFDQNKKPLPKPIVVWITKEIK